MQYVRNQSNKKVIKKNPEVIRKSRCPLKGRSHNAVYGTYISTYIPSNLTETHFSIVLYIVKATELKIDSSLSKVHIPELDMKRQSKLYRKSDEVIFENGVNYATVGSIPCQCYTYITIHISDGKLHTNILET